MVFTLSSNKILGFLFSENFINNPYLQKLAPTWEDLAKDFENDKSVSVSKIDCTQYRTICQEFEVKVS